MPFDASFNTSNKSREYECFKLIYSSRILNEKPWGLLSWKFNIKTLITIEDFLQYANSQFAFGYDCVFINPMIGHEALYKNVWEQGALNHKGIDKLIDFFTHKIPDFNNNFYTESTFSFCNYFIAKPNFWIQYFKFIDEFIDLLNIEEKIGSNVGKIWSGSANYPRNPLITMKPFVIERLFSSFLIMNPNIRHINYTYKNQLYANKFGSRLGLIVKNLSIIKNEAISKRDNTLLNKWNLIRLKLFQNKIAGTIFALDDPSNMLIEIEQKLQSISSQT